MKVTEANSDIWIYVLSSWFLPEYFKEKAEKICLFFFLREKLEKEVSFHFAIDELKKEIQS